MFKKKNKEPEYLTFEADDYYPDEEMNEYEPQKSKKTKKNKGSKSNDDYYYESYQELESTSKGHGSTKVVIVLIAYVVFIIIGAFSTSFMTNAVGTKEAQVVNVQLREQRESYYTLKAQYFAIKELLTAVQATDDKLASSNGDNAFVYSTEYQTTLSNIDKKQYLPTAKSMVVDDKYSTLKNQTVNIYQDLAYYLQKMSDALSNKDAGVLDQALSWKQKTLEDFENFRSNMREFAKLLKIDDAEFSSTQPVFKMNTTVPQGSNPAPASPSSPSDTQAK